MKTIAESMNRKVNCVVETNINDSLIGDANGKKAYQFVKYVTKKKVAIPNKDYFVENVDDNYGFETIVLSGKKGFIKLTLVPLFATI